MDDAEVLQNMQTHCMIEEHGRSIGHRVIQVALMRRAGVRVPRAQVLRVQKAHDPHATAARRERLLHRQRYSETEAMILWHIDSQ